MFIENRIEKKETKQIVVYREKLVMRIKGFSVSVMGNTISSERLGITVTDKQQ